MKDQAAIQLPTTDSGSNAASKILNIAIGIMALALLVTGGALLYLHFRPLDQKMSSQERTLQRWKDTVDQNPDNSLVRANLGAAYLDMGDVDNAIEQLRFALDQEPGSFTYMYKLGLAYREADQLDNSIQMFTSSAEGTPKSEKYSALYEAATSAMMKGDNEAAKNYVQQSLADNDMIWNSHFLLGKLLEQEGDTAGAKEQYDAANKFNPGDPALQEALDRLSS